MEGGEGGREEEMEGGEGERGREGTRAKPGNQLVKHKTGEYTISTGSILASCSRIDAKSILL